VTPLSFLSRSTDTQNVVLVIANGTGTVLVLEGWTKAADRIQNGGILDEMEIRNLGRYLYKLQLDPDWDVQLNQLGELWNQTNPPRSSTYYSNRTTVTDKIESPDLINLQYLGQIAITSFQLYSLEVPDKTYDTYQDLAAANTTTIGDSTVNNQLIQEAFYNVTEIINEPFTLALTGTLWLYPTAVCRTSLKPRFR
jgi:hypothetical protein